MRFPQIAAIEKLAKNGVFLTSLLLIFAGAAVMAPAQEVGTKRGFQEGGSYALSDIEKINTTNGNLIMHFPMASLPAGRGGLSAGINLIYNSKLYDSHTSWFLDNGKNCQPGSGDPAPLICSYYQKDELQQSNDGGWNYMLGYTIEVVDRIAEHSIDPNLQCSINGAQSDGYMPMTYHYKLKVHFPDGSVHEMRPYGYSDLNQQDTLLDYYNIRPDGWVDDCFQGGHWSTASIVSYYSTDGTYLRLDFQTISHDGWWNDPWTLSMPDGTRVTGGNAPERIYDRNNNYVEVDGTQLTDQLNRTVTLVYNGAGLGEDTITAQGFGDTLVWKIHHKVIGVDKPYWPCPESLTPCQIHDTNYSGPPGPDTFHQQLDVVDRITLPAQAGNLTYTFNYNAPDYNGGDFQPSVGWGELSGVTLPSTATAAYQYNFDNDQTAEYTPDVMKDFPTRKDLSYHQQYDGTSNPVTETWLYGTSDYAGAGNVIGPDGGVTTDYAIPTNYAVSWQAWNVGMVYKSVHPDGSMTERIWAKNKLGDYGVNETFRGDNPYVKTEFTSIKNAAGAYSKTKITDYNYDKNGNVTQAAEYDWVDYGSVQRDSNGNPTGTIPGSAVRVTTNTYYASSPDASQLPSGGNVYWLSSSPQLKNAAISSEVSSGSGVVASRTELTYDNPLTTGNLTQKTSWDSTKGIYSSPLTTGNSISVFMQYNQYGSPILTTDARGYQALMTYGNVGGFTDLYPTQIQTAYGTAVQRTETRVYDFLTGLVTQATDADNNVSTSTTYDVFGRPTLVIAAVGKPEETHVATQYDDVNRRVILQSDMNTAGDGKLVKIEHYDEVGRVRLSRQLEDSTQSATDETTGVKVQARYLYSGANSYQYVSNPYRAAYSNLAGNEATMGWTRSTADNSGRMIEVQTFGGSSLPSAWGNNTTTTGTVTSAYDAELTTVTDQIGNKRRSVVDGLGRLGRVDEPDTNGNLGGNTTPIQPTSYTYDVLGNLTQVSQGSQTRAFVYSSLARLLSATNPESGMVCYGAVVSGQCQGDGYDANGNLTKKTDARSVVSNYIYDPLNRATSRTYSDGTPSVTYAYDPAITNGKGQLGSVSSSVSSYTYTVYDAFGRAKTGIQRLGSQSYQISAVYDLAGHIKSEAYPSGRTTVSYVYDGAGRTNSFTGNLGDGASPRNYAIGIVYDAGSRMSQEQFGTGTAIYNKLFYNSRGQLAEIREGTTPNDALYQRGAIINHYSNYCWGMCTGGSMPDNNGNLKKQDNYVPDDEQVSNYHTFTDFFAYDSLNRLQTVTETNYVSATNQTTTPWQQTYIYDRFGNRRIDPSQTWGTGINNTNFSVDQNTNRLGVPSGQSGTMGYDPAGNLTTDTYSGGGGRTYDAENRMITATTGTEFNQYTYDGDGRRVKRNIGEVETWQVYGFGGELLAEYAVNGAPASPQKEYGYRNGQLLITATVTTGWGAAPTLHDNPLQVGVTTVQALHISELRDAINALRSHLGMSAYTWQYSATTSDYISANPIVEMRTALDQALGAPSGGYSAGLAQGQPVKAIHIQELRDRVLGAWITSSSTDLRWLVTDQLGTPRMIFDQSGTLAGVSRHDYLPFGEELVVGQGLRTAAMGYATNDGVRQHFTLKERDNETGLDFFGARYYASAQGRFTSTDPALTSADVATPQSWNRYAYSFNNPLKYIDPTGAWNWSAALGGSDSDEDLRNKAGKDKNALKAANKIVDRRNLFRNGLNAARAAGPRSDEPDTVARAANSYGSEGDSNGVTVTFGTTANGSAADTGPSPDGGLSFDANGTATAQVLVTISDSAKTDTNSLAQDIGHEGWHVADRQSFASYLTRQIQGAGGLANFVGTPLETQAFSSPYNRTVQTTEFNAYIVSGLIAQGRDALGNDFPNSNFNGHEVWNRSWKAAERPGLRAVGAFEQATTSPLYSNRLDHRIFPQ